MPTHVIVGGEDHLTTPEMCRSSPSMIPGARLTVIPDAGHLVNIEKPGRVQRGGGRFIRAACPPGAYGRIPRAAPVVSKPRAPKPRRAPHSARDVILKAATEVFIEHGFVGSSIDQIAARAGVFRSRRSTVTSTARRNCSSPS